MITVALLLMATVAIVFRVSSEFEKRSSERERDVSRDSAGAKAAQVSIFLKQFKDEALAAGKALMTQNFQSEIEKNEFVKSLFRDESEMVNVAIYERKDGRQSLLHQFQKPGIIEEYKQKDIELTPDYFTNLHLPSIKPFPTANVFAGNVEVRNGSLKGGVPLMTVGVPLGTDDEGNFNSIVVADFKIEGIQKNFSKAGVHTYFLVDKDSVVLAHPEDKEVLNSENYSASSIVKSALESTNPVLDLSFRHHLSNEKYIGAFAQTTYGPVVIAQAPEEVIFELARTVKREAIYITGLVLSGSVFLIFLFSISLTNPIERLVSVTRQVASGNFDVHANIKSHDEVGELAASFDTMVDGLKERDKIKNVMNKFHGSSVTEDLMKGDLQLGGKNREVVVFFSDIRDFTKFSEGHTPEEVVEMLNEYFEIMVGICTKNHGVVDKFIGDAMMAIWGAPNTTGQDEYYCLKACLEMRMALEELNKLRIARGQVEIKIGIGVNTGPAIAGTIGSSERMEYTVIGDTVNTASRIESSTKAFGTDLLISGETLAKVEGKFVTEYAGAAEVKGKSEPLKMHKIKGYIDENGNTVMVQTKYSDYEAGHADKVKIA